MTYTISIQSWLVITLIYIICLFINGAMNKRFYQRQFDEFKEWVIDEIDELKYECACKEYKDLIYAETDNGDQTKEEPEG